jgi:hypothetical protein
MGQRSDRLLDLQGASKVGRCAGSEEARGRAVQATKKVRDSIPTRLVYTCGQEAAAYTYWRIGIAVESKTTTLGALAFSGVS